MKIKNRNRFLLFLLIPLAAGFLSALLGGNMAKYAGQNRPPASPPAWVFPLVWTILYLFMGISSYLVCASESQSKENAFKTYALQLFFNFFWSILFFGFSQYFLSFLWLLALLALVGIMICQFYQIRPGAAYLQIPYFLWCVFAAYLNFMVYRLN